MPVFLDGFLVGLALVILIGPVFFTLLKTSLQHGVVAGSLVALGIFISDILAVLLCVYGASAFLKSDESRFYLALVGGVVLIALGVRYFLKKKKAEEEAIQLNTKHYIGFFSKGFLVNFVNPFVFAVWIGIIKVAGDKHGFEKDLGIYLAGTLLAIFSTDMTKVFLAAKIKNILKPLILFVLYKIIGVCLILLGLRLFYVAFS
ncbi:MAG TPA: LysE family transporter [Bacteroidia bacterium]|nr:LysE family transporter [Bacteroidia bacterium]